MPNCQTLRPCHIYIVVVKYSFVCSLNPFWPTRMFTVIYCAYSYWPMPYAGVYKGYYPIIIQPNYFPRSSAYYLTFEMLYLGLRINCQVFAMKLDIIELRYDIIISKPIRYRTQFGSVFIAPLHGRSLSGTRGC